MSRQEGCLFLSVNTEGLRRTPKETERPWFGRIDAEIDRNRPDRWAYGRFVQSDVTASTRTRGRTRTVRTGRTWVSRDEPPHRGGGRRLGPMTEIADELDGGEIASVTFVRDYVQMTLEVVSDGGRTVGLTFTTSPVVHEGDETFREGDSGWRDALCHLIGRRVNHALVEDGIEFRLTFDPAASLRVSLREDDYRFGPEAVVVNGRGTWVY